MTATVWEIRFYKITYTGNENAIYDVTNSIQINPSASASPKWSTEPKPYLKINVVKNGFNKLYSYNYFSQRN